jgi:glycosyltransferase involved in cell wall biosynthesis
MRVLVFSNMYPTPEKPWWGTFVKEQVDDLRRIGLDVGVLPFDGTDDRWAYVRAVAAFHRAIGRGRYDLVHAHYGLVGAIAVTQRRVPVVTTFHGGDFTGLVPWHAAVSRVVARLSTPVVVTTDGVTRLGVSNAVVIPAGVDTQRFKPRDRAAARRELGLEEGVPYALLLGARDDPNKRPDLFDAGVAVARRTTPDLTTLSLEGLDRDQVATLMNAVDVGVLTSDTEGSPVAVREALASSTPVVAVAVGSVPEVLEGLPGCALVPREPESIGAGIVRALAAGRPDALRARAEETSGLAIAARLAALYEEILARGTGRFAPRSGA